jgi:hypothetical protein
MDRKEDKEPKKTPDVPKKHGHKTEVIRLNDLIPKKDVTGGRRLFGTGSKSNHPKNK